MKYIFSLIIPLCFLPFLAFSQEGWVEQLKIIHASLNDIQSPDDKNLWVAGDSGAVLFMYSGGDVCTLYTQETGITSDLNGVYFFNTGKGWCVGDSGMVIRSETFGNKWEIFPLGLSAKLNDIWFADYSHGVIVGDTGILLITANGGESWNLDTLFLDINLNTITTLPGSGYWIIANEGVVIRSQDYGESWEIKQTGFADNLNDICLLGDGRAYIAGDNGLLIRTEDDGNTWQQVSFPVVYDLNAVACVNYDSLYVCGDHGTWFMSDNGGLNWESSASPLPVADIHAVFLGYKHPGLIFAADSGYCGDCVMYMNNWNNFCKPGEITNLLEIDFLDNQNGFVGGMMAQLFRTHDGGAHWHSINLGYNDPFLEFADMDDIDFINPEIGWIILHKYSSGDYSWIFHTNDSGVTWEKQYYSEEYNLRSICFTDENNGWAAGGNGLVLHTENGGLDWTVQQEMTQDQEDIMKIYFNDPQNGYLLQWYGWFKMTEDGGDNWQVLTYLFEVPVNFSVAEDSVIYVLNWDELVYKSDDGGSSWETQELPPAWGRNFYIFFLNKDEGWITGEGEVIYHTSDGGDNWELEYLGNAGSIFRDVFFTDAEHGWIATGGQGILHGHDLYVNLKDHDNISENKLTICPNPGSGEVTLAFAVQKVTCVLSIYNIEGRLVYKEYWPAETESVKLNFEGLYAGIYYTILEDGSNLLATGKFVIVK
jgi:photosystem II stability/assembly factor-like uncharacterized protein